MYELHELASRLERAELLRDLERADLLRDLDHAEHVDRAPALDTPRRPGAWERARLRLRTLHPRTERRTATNP